MLFLIFFAFQSLSYEKEVVDSLSSHHFYGRGYEFSADKRVANYLRTKFIKSGLKAINHNFFQSFPIQTNLFEKTPKLKINGITQAIGIDYIPHPSSGSGTARVDSSEIVEFSESFLQNPRLLADLRDKLVLIDEKYMQQKGHVFFASPRQSIAVFEKLSIKALFIQSKKLTYSKAFYFSRIPIFVLKTNEKIRYLHYSLFSEQEEVESQNVIGFRKGKSDSLIVLMAHYDHLGAIGDSVFFAGANDNASGVAMMLSLAREIRKKKYSLLCIAFSGEESGLLGSKYFLENPLVDLSQIKFILNFDMLASAEDGIVVVGGKEFPKEYGMLTKLNEQQSKIKIRKRSNAPISDQYFFLKRGIKGFYIYTNKGKQPYHSIFDKAESLEWDDFLVVKSLLIPFIQDL